MHMRLNADRVDLDAGFEAAFHQNVIGGRRIEVVDQQGRTRVLEARGCEHGANGRDAAQFPAEAREAVVILVEDGHDDGFIDHIPHIDQAAEIRDLAPDASRLPREDLRGAQRKKPIWREGMPTQRMTLGDQTVIHAPAGGIL